MTLDMTSFAGALKTLYPSDAVRDMTYKNRPFLAMVPKDETFFGLNQAVPVIYGNPQGRSADINRAITRSAISGVSTLIAQFSITRAKDYGVVVIDREAMMASQSDEGAFLRARKVEIDGTINAISNSLSNALYRDGFGSIGQIATTTTIASTSITLSTPEDSVNFEVGMELDVSSTNAASITRAYGSSNNGLIITGVDRIQGTLTFGFNLNDATNGIPTIAVSDFLFVRGDRQNSATPVTQKVVGLAGWVPSSAPTSTLFFGVNRTADSTRLGGLRYNGVGLPAEEAVINALRLAGREGASIERLFISYDRYADLEKSLGSRIQYVKAEIGTVSFKGIEFNGPGSTVEVYPDKDCPVNKAYALELSDWKLWSLGKAPGLFDTDIEMLRQPTADAYQIRAGYYANLICHAPGHNVNITL